MTIPRSRVFQPSYVLTFVRSQAGKTTLLFEVVVAGGMQEGYGLYYSY